RYDFRDIRPLGQVETKAAGGDRLREQEDISDGRPVSDGKVATPATGDPMLDRSHALFNPVPVPSGNGVGIGLEGRSEMQPDPGRQERVNLGGDGKRNRTRLRSVFECSR